MRVIWLSEDTVVNSTLHILGTKIPILSDEMLFKDKKSKSPIINFAWHISKEIKTYLSENNFKGKIVNIIE